MSEQELNEAVRAILEQSEAPPRSGEIDPDRVFVASDYNDLLDELESGLPEMGIRDVVTAAGNVPGEDLDPGELLDVFLVDLEAAGYDYTFITEGGGMGCAIAIAPKGGLPPAAAELATWVNQEYASDYDFDVE